jgi:hypothetical protein
MAFAAMMTGGQYATREVRPGAGREPLTASIRRRLRRVTSGGVDMTRRVPCDEQISWPTAEHTAPDLACIIPVGYSVSAWIDGKEKVYGSIP